MRRFLAWIAASSALTGILLLQKGIALNKLSLAYIERTGSYPYIVLALCTLMLYLKREKIVYAMQNKPRPFHVIAGIALVALSIFPPADKPALQIFALILLWLGVFTALFGEATLLPLALLGIYGVALVFPSLVVMLGSSYPLTTTTILVALLRPFLPITNYGQTIHFIDAAGARQAYIIDAACSGSTSLAIFLSIFLLMIVDTHLSKRKTGYMLIFGLLGTSLQNILRLIVLVFAGYWYGSSAVWTAHAYAGYILFPAWYALFAYVYLKQAKRV